MRVINLDATGIKLISSKRKQIYLNKDEISALLDKKYQIENNRLLIANKSLDLSDSDLESFDGIMTYIRSNFG